MVESRDVHAAALWELAKPRMTRRRFLALLAASGAAAVLAACGVRPAPEVVPAVEPVTGGPGDAGRFIFKDPAAFIVHDEKSWEARLELMQGLLTPNRPFFVRNNSASLDLEAGSWRLSVEG